MTIFTQTIAAYNSRLKTDLGINDVQASGIWGNIGGETGGFSALQEKRPVIAGSKGGYGWMQWTGPRRRKYFEWCKLNNLDVASNEANYRYLVHETLTDEVKSLIQLRKTTSIESATETFMRQNLRPGTPHLEGRINWAHKAFDTVKEEKQINSKAVTTVAVVAGTAAATAAAPHLWPWIAGGALITLIVGWILVHRYHEKQAEAIKSSAKRGKKKNGSKKES